jgi:hypothetical protein
MHLADARAPLIRREMRNKWPEFTFEMTDLYGENIQHAERSFTRISDTRLQIRDKVTFSPDTRTLTWQMITQAEVDIRKGGVMLEQEGKSLSLSIPGEVPYEVSVTSLSPPPLSYDKDIPGLKRLEIQWNREDFSGQSATLIVEFGTKETTHED